MPLTLAGISLRGTRVPTTLYSEGAFTGADPVNGTLNSLPPTRSPYVTDWFGRPFTETTPLLTTSCSTGASSFWEAIFSNAWRASAEAVRNWGPPRWIDALE